MIEGWVIKKLGEVLQKTETINPIQKPDEKFIYIDVSSIDNQKFIITNTTTILGKNAPSRARKFVRENDIIFATVRPTLKRIAIIPKELNGEVCSTGYFVLRPNESIHYKLLFYYLQTEDFISSMEKLQKGASYPAVTDGEVRQQLICYSRNFPEQHRIVSILDEAFAAIDQAKENTKRNLQNAKDLFQSELNAIFTNKGEGWVARKIEDVSKVVNGFSFKSNDFSSTNKIKSVKITNVGVKQFVEEEGNYLPIAFSETFSEYSVQEGNIVIALTRTIISSGLKVAVVPKSYEGALINQRVAALVANHKIISQRFLYNFLCTDLVTNYVKANVNTLMQPNLSIYDLKKMPINCPPLEIQKQIVHQLDALSAETKKLETLYQQKLNNLEDLKKSILEKAFKGELKEREVAV